MKTQPDHTAIRVALWRALHVHLDPKPHVFVDEIGAKAEAFLVAQTNTLSR